MSDVPWIEKYRPKKLDDMKQNKNLLDLIANIIKTKEMTHCLFYGPPGTGKTSAVFALGREIFGRHFADRVVEFNASSDRGISAVREKIAGVAKKYVSEIIEEDGTIIPAYKIIILDEADSMTEEAQDALRVIIEQYSSVTIFCFICNYISKITDAIKSRCTQIYFKKLDNESMISKLTEISEKESMELTDDICKAVIEISNGDMRKAVMLMQNLKYYHDFKKFKNSDEIDINKLKYMYLYKNKNSNISSNITVNDVYTIAAHVPIKKTTKIIEIITNCKNIKEIHKLSNKIISRGYPIDNIITQMTKSILINDKFDEYEKAKIIKYSGNILYKMKECSNEKIQLIDFLSCIYGIYNSFSCYNNL